MYSKQIYCRNRPGGYYFTVYFFRTKKLFNKFAALSSAKSQSYYNERAAVCRSYITPSKSKMELGDILFWGKHAGTNTVSHEMVHATCRYFEKTGRKVIFHKWEVGEVGEDSDEELFATVVGDMCQQYWKWYYDELEKK